jgi:hypothetical protein
MPFFGEVTKMELHKTQVLIVFAVATIAITGTVVFALLSASQTISNTGNIKTVGVGVYSDSGCTQKVTLIPWGSLAPGQTIQGTVYVRNEGSIKVTLSMTTAEWDPPSASSSITLTWNRGGYTLNAGASVQATLTLSVSSSISGVSSFTFDIIITGTESS